MEISNGYLKLRSGAWVNLSCIDLLEVQGDTILAVSPLHGWVVEQFDNEVHAQSELDKLMRSKWS